MKKVLFVLALAFLFSCEKELCYECTTTITTTGGSYASDQIVSTLTSCGISEADARMIEKEMTSTVTDGRITVREVTKCKEQ